jgi:phosphohistidine phosphatase SixA
MRLTFLRHGLAEDRSTWVGDDADRPLTKEGIDRTRRVLKACADLIDGTCILASPWRRAWQTAELAGKIWDLPVQEAPWLVPDAATVGQRRRRLEDGMILVGHEPDLGALLGAVLGGPPLALAKAGLAVVEGDPPELRFLLRPAVVRALCGG